MRNFVLQAVDCFTADNLANAEGEVLVCVKLFIINRFSLRRNIIKGLKNFVDAGVFFSRHFQNAAGRNLRQLFAYKLADREGLTCRQVALVDGNNSFILQVFEQGSGVNLFFTKGSGRIYYI